MPEGSYAGSGETRHVSDPVALLKRQYRDVEGLFGRIGKTEDAAERRRLLDLIIQKLALRRVLAVLLKDYGSLCERCLAHYARMALPQAAATIGTLEQVIAISVEHGECPECQQCTRTYFLAKTNSASTRNVAS
jgi:hypothetical protein